MASIDQGASQRRGSSQTQVSPVEQASQLLPRGSTGESYFQTALFGSPVGHDTQSIASRAKESMVSPVYQTGSATDVTTANGVYASSSKLGALAPIGTGVTGPVNVYKMRGYFNGAPEEWIAIGTPNNTPPSGHVLQGVSVMETWTQ